MLPMMVTASLQLVHLNFTSFETTTNLDESPKVKNISPYMTAKILYEGFISIFGAPKRILMDQGKAFTSEVVGQLCSQFGISQLTTTAYHPQGNI